MRKAFTLIELLVVIAIIAVLAVVVVLTLNPAQLLAQSRDANRVSDMATLNSAIGLYQTDIGGSGSMGSSSVVYTSLPDNASSTCGSLGLAALPSSTAYNCSASTSTRLTNNQGWIPLNFQNISSGAPFGSLPVDPTNQSSSGLYYSYVASGTSYMVTAIPESARQKQALGARPMIPNYPDVIANGSSLSISPLFNTNGLVGYWPMDEGAGSGTQDLSGNNNSGTWVGTPSGINGTYYVAGKVGSWAGNFDGSTNYITKSSAIYDLTDPFAISIWINTTNLSNYHDIITVYTSVTNSVPYLAILGSGNLRFQCTDVGTATRSIDWYVGNGATLSNGAWHLITFSYSGNNFLYYQDGMLNATSIAWTYGCGNVSNTLRFGLGWAGKFIGSIDDVRIYNRALSAAEVMALYNAEK